MSNRAANGSRATVTFSLVALATAIVGLAVSFGVSISADQQRAVLAFVTAAVVASGVLHLSGKVDVVAASVDGHLAGLEDRISQLESKLVASGVAIPPSPPSLETQAKEG
jgi:cobalamin synthase